MPKIWIRPSQRKISYENFRPVQLIFDLIQPPRVTLPGHKSFAVPEVARLVQYANLLDHVSTKAFVELMKETLDEEVQPLAKWTGSKAMLLLWRTVGHVDGVTMKRALQHALGTERALGLSGRVCKHPFRRR